MNTLARTLPDRLDRVSLESPVERAHSLRQLDDEQAARARRIALRREQRAKAERAARRARRLRAFRLSGVWAVLIAVGFFAATWFSSDFVAWLNSLRRAI